MTDTTPDHDLADLRQDYKRGALDEESVRPDPVDQFAVWFYEARSANLTEPNAMIVATVSAAGLPSARTVLLKGFGADGFRFYTNYESQKGRDIAANGRIALLFYWAELERQVRIDGTVERLDRETTRAYFNSRPRGSQLSALASPQSRPIDSRDALDAMFEHAEAEHDSGEVPLPDYWGGYLVVPARFEFWQGRPSRRHDRITYEHTPGTAGWSIGRLAP
ncbi:MAG TPA: pyridoxamine 5'-phosphate oxidase [Thermomicrobiales bacterium]|jgi:pyridoxamine-phosphate oxidase|nr:pyridoxamine 5'-phosphate oxidase [Thermomicrobiales bacterium]